MRHCLTSLNELEIRQKLKDDFEHYANKSLKIRTKEGGVEPFMLNKAQRYLHARLESQLERTGKVRALVLKGRQQGCSTYIGGRFYHKVTHRKGYRVFILTHADDATSNLFGMVSRYHDNCPEIIRPHTGNSNAKELDFDLLDSGYKVGTAGTRAVGRSQTIQLFHGSEVAFWSHADEHAAGVIQAIPDIDGTESILESTANGMGNFFHRKWQEAEQGISDYEAIFIPWYWQDEYSKQVNDNFILTEEEQEYKDAYGLNLEQMAWRRTKITDLGDPLLFKQEYPATSAEAFQLTGHDSYIPSNLVLKARKNTVEAYGPLIIGFDPARYGDDRFSVAWRRGRKILKVENRFKLDTVAGANWIKSIIDSDNPDAVFGDVGGIGGGVIDILKSWGKPYEDVKAINFGGEPQTNTNKGGPRNRRAEMWQRSKEWLEEVLGVDLPDSDELQADACSTGYKYDMQSRLLLESKEDMKRKGIRSPDMWDAVVLTFAEPVRPKPEKIKYQPKVMEIGNQSSRNLGWMKR